MTRKIYCESASTHLMRRRFYVFGLRANIDVGKTRHLSWQNKYFVASYDKNGNILASSKTIHVATSGGKKGNTKAVKLNKKKATLKKGKTVKLKATLKNGKLKVSKHRKNKYMIARPRISSVDIKAAEVGEEAARRILAQLDDEKKKEKPYKHFEPEIIIRDSCH